MLGFQNADWDEYIKYRPAYPQSIFDRIYAQHSQDPSSSYDLANDCGAGAGIASEILATRFIKVVVSTPNGEYLAIARACISPKFPGEKFEFKAEGGEESSLESGTVDLVTILEAIHWCDIDAALREFHRQLKNGGTLCIAHYSKPCARNHDDFGKLWDGAWKRVWSAINPLIR